ncbi:MAG: LTA synthase family protein [Bacilli bacterium]
MKEKIKHGLKIAKKNIVEYVLTNRLFISYVVLSLIMTVLVRKFTIGSFFALKPLLTDLGLIILIGGLGYFVKPKNQFKYYFVWVIFFTALCIISSIYYRFYTSFASFGELATLTQMETVTGSLAERIKLVDIMYILVPFIFYFIHRKLSSSTYYYFIEKIEKGKKMVVGTLLVATLFLAYSFGTANGTDYSRLAKQWNRVFIVERFGIITYQFNDLVQSLTPKISSLFGYEEALTKFNDYFSKKEVHEENKYTGVLKGYNIVFVHMESMQTFLMDVKLNGKELTPQLNNLAKEGMFFNNFYPQVSTGTSSDTEFSLLTGLMPAASGTVFVSYYDRKYFTLPKYLKENGYYSFSMHGNFSSMWGRNKAHPSLGYQGMFYEESFKYTKDDVVNLGINDHLFFQQAIPIMENIENTYSNYMGTVITLSNHSPFTLASAHSDYDLSYTFNKTDEKTNEVKTITTDYLSESVVGGYFKSVNYADGALGDFLKYIKESKNFDKTLFVFYGDHDAKLSKQEIDYYYNLNPETGDTYKEGDPLYVDYDFYKHELNKKTPLIMWSKNKDLSRIFKGKIDYTMGMYDVSTTILNMYGLNNKYSVGHDIFNTKEDNMVIFPNGNFLTSKLYYNNSTSEYEVFDKKFKVDQEYIDKLIKITEEKLEVSNSIIVYNLLDTVSMTGE